MTSKQTKQKNNNTPHPGGRPTKYKKRYAKEMLEYFQSKSGSELKKEVIEEQFSPSGKVKMQKYKVFGSDLPFFYDFADQIGVHDETLLNWSRAMVKVKNSAGKVIREEHKHPEFFVAYKKCREIVKKILIKNGLQGLYNSNFAMFVAKNVTDMRDQHEVIVEEKKILIDN